MTYSHYVIRRLLMFHGLAGPERLEQRHVFAAYTFTPIAESTLDDVVSISQIVAPSINAAGAVAYEAQFENDTFKVVLDNGTGEKTVAVSSDRDIVSGTRLSLNDHGTLAFTGSVSNSHGVFIAEAFSPPSPLLVIPRVEGPPDDGDYTWENVTPSSINNSNDIVFGAARFEWDGDGNVTNTVQGIFQAVPGSYPLLLEDITDPDPYESDFAIGAPSINDDFNLAYTTTTGGTALSLLTRRDGLISTAPLSISAGGINAAGTVAFLRREENAERIMTGDGTSLLTIAGTDDAAAQFTGFLGNPAISSDGSVAFYGTLDSGSRGIFLQHVSHSDGDETIRTGSPVTVIEASNSLFLSNGASRTHPFEFVWSSEGMNDNGQLAVTTLFNDGSTGVYRAEPALTVVVHGFSLSNSFPDWVTDMGHAISERAGFGCDDLQIANSRVKYDVDPELFDLSSDACANLLMLDWSEVSSVPGNAEQVGKSLANLVKSLLPVVGKRSIHFIGHSRGAFVIREAIEQLQSLDDRIGLLQMTTLDPQGFSPAGFPLDDGLLYVPNNVDFADNYFQKAGSLVLPGDEGESVDGALNVDLTEVVKSWNRGLNHSEVHEWYHWTIDTEPTDDTQYLDAQPLEPAERESVLFPVDVWKRGTNVAYFWSVGGDGIHARPMNASVDRFGSAFVVIDEFTHVDAVPNPDPETVPNGFKFPSGVFDVSAAGLPLGGAITVTFYLPVGVVPTTYYIYGRTAENPMDHWYEFMFDGKTGATIEGNIVTLRYVDGERGDSDLVANGEIVDPGGPAFLEGDINADGNVSLVDFNILKSNFGTSGTIRSLGDLDGDTAVSLADFTILKRNFSPGAIIRRVARGKLERELSRDSFDNNGYLIVDSAFADDTDYSPTSVEGLYLEIVESPLSVSAGSS